MSIFMDVVTGHTLRCGYPLSVYRDGHSAFIFSRMLTVIWVNV